MKQAWRVCGGGGRARPQKAGQEWCVEEENGTVYWLCSPRDISNILLNLCWCKCCVSHTSVVLSVSSRGKIIRFPVARGYNDKRDSLDVK